ncbi:MAG TPA: DUF4097 family beta strand repeat-containing protein [Pyrinomonadaceae bacterium]|nr:DUF4097 family beta strand repeat-containing protein [Pyrinomonadaceae bacterium]
MKRLITLAGLMCLMMLAAGADLKVLAQADFNWRGSLAAGRVVEIKGVNGNVEARPSRSGQVEVRAERRARRSNPEEVRVEVIEHADGVTICAVYPSADTSRPNTCQPGDGGHMSVRNNDTSVNFFVSVPAGVRFRGKTVNGNVGAEGLAADVDAKTVNGNVRVSTTGLASAKTVNGSITAALGRADWTDGLEFKTVNGEIDLSLPASLSTTVEAETLNGDIQTDFALTVTGRFSKRRLSGTIGGGGRELRLKTVNGSVHIRRAS